MKSNNICIGNAGITGDNKVARFGTAGIHDFVFLKQWCKHI